MCLQSKDTTPISPLEAGLSLGWAFGPLGAIFELSKHMGLQSTLGRAITHIATHALATPHRLPSHVLRVAYVLLSTTHSRSLSNSSTLLSTRPCRSPVPHTQAPPTSLDLQSLTWSLPPRHCERGPPSSSRTTASSSTASSCSSCRLPAVAWGELPHTPSRAYREPLPAKLRHRLGSSGSRALCCCCCCCYYYNY
jgi:hypothetical protein